MLFTSRATASLWLASIATARSSISRSSTGIFSRRFSRASRALGSRWSFENIAAESESGAREGGGCPCCCCVGDDDGEGERGEGMVGSVVVFVIAVFRGGVVSEDGEEEGDGRGKAVDEEELVDEEDDLTRGGKVGMGALAAFASAMAASWASMRWKSVSACIWICSSTMAGLGEER